MEVERFEHKAVDVGSCWVEVVSSAALVQLVMRHPRSWVLLTRKVRECMLLSPMLCGNQGGNRAGGVRKWAGGGGGGVPTVSL